MIEHILDCAVFDQQLRRGLRSDAGHPWNVVRAVPHQAFHIDEANRRESVFLLEHLYIIGACIADPLFRQHDSQSITDQLQRIAVTRHDDSLHSLCSRLRRQCTDDVICLVVIQLEERNPKCLRQFLQQRNLGDQLLRRLIARPLVLRIERRTERRAALVKGDDDLRRIEFLEQLHEHHRKAVYGVRMDPARIRRELESIKRTEKEAAPVEDCKICLHRRGISSFSRRMRIKR